MIYVKGLSKSYGDNQVIKNIDMHIAPGEKVVIIGPSGSGISWSSRPPEVSYLMDRRLPIRRQTLMRSAVIWEWYSSILICSTT